MDTLVLDSSVIFDLERGLLIPAAFRLHMQFATPDLLIEEELGDDPLVLQMLDLGLTVIELDASEIQAAQDLVRKYRPKLSQVDAWALVAAARDTSDRLLSGDGALREAARLEKVPCSGVLWVLEQIRAARSASTLQLRDGLKRIREHTRARLPAAQVEALMQQLERDLKTAHESASSLDTSLQISETRADGSTVVYRAEVDVIRGQGSVETGARADGGVASDVAGDPTKLSS
jgi:hypothetical protein